MKIHKIKDRELLIGQDLQVEYLPLKKTL